MDHISKLNRILQHRVKTIKILYNNSVVERDPLKRVFFLTRGSKLLDRIEYLYSKHQALIHPGYPVAEKPEWTIAVAILPDDSRIRMIPEYL